MPRLRFTRVFAIAQQTMRVAPYADLYVFYGLRNVPGVSYGAGPVLRVRRSSDNAEQDIGMSGGALNTAALMAFAGSASAFVTTWYEPLRGLHATQTAAANQPRIVDAGVLETDGGLPTLRFLNASRHNLVLPLLGIFDDSYSVNFVGRFDTPPTADYNIAVGNKSTVDTTIPGISLDRGFAATSGRLRALLTGNGVTRILIGSVPQNYPYRDIVTLTRAPTLASLFGNGALQASSAAITAAEQPSENSGVRLGGLSGTRSFQGTLSEVTFFPTAIMSDQRQSLERNQGAYYGISVA